MQVNEAVAGDHYRLLSAPQFADVVESAEFVNREFLIVIKDPKKLPGFRFHIKTADLDDDVVLKHMLGGKGKLNVRRYNEQWEDVVTSVDGDHVGELFKRNKGKYYNIIDCDARLTDTTRFTKPDAIRDVSINEEYKEELTVASYAAADRLSHFLLVSQPGAITLWHQDFSATSVFYFLIKGCKIFYFVRPTANNVRLWKGWLAQPRRDLFFGSHSELDDGGCVKVVLTERQAVCMPAGYIHCVETIGLSVAFG